MVCRRRSSLCRARPDTTTAVLSSFQLYDNYSSYPASQGNQGEVRVVQIKDGVYDSAKERSPGVYPGPTTVRIAGFDGKPLRLFPQGKQIFNPHEIRDTLEGGTRDFDVPASAADNLKITPMADK